MKPGDLLFTREIVLDALRLGVRPMTLAYFCGRRPYKARQAYRRAYRWLGVRNRLQAAVLLNRR